MADLNWTPSGGVSNFYTGTMAPPVKGPNGTLVRAPVYGQPTTIEEIYRGILPVAPPPSPRSPVGAGTGSYGNLLGLLNDPIYSSQPTQSANSGSMRTTGQAGTNAIPAGARPASVDRAFAQMPAPPPITLPSGPGPVGFVNDAKSWDRLAPGTGLAFNGEPAPLPALAAIDNATVPLPRIRPNPPAAPRSGGSSSVSAIQQQLADRGFSPGAIDGIPGAKTDAAIRAFQKANGLAADGIVGPKTMAALQGSQPSQSRAPLPMPRPPSLSIPSAAQSGADPFGLMSLVKSLPQLPGTLASRTAAIDVPIKKAMTSTNKPAPPPGKPAGYGSRGYSVNSAKAAMPWAF